MAVDFVGAVTGRRRKSACERRNKALRSEARRLRHAQVVGAAMAQSWRTSSIGSLVPVLSSSLLLCHRLVWFLVALWLTTVFLLCFSLAFMGTVPEHDPGLVRFLLTRTLLDRELEDTNTEREKGDVHVLAVSFFSRRWIWFILSAVVSLSGWIQLSPSCLVVLWFFLSCHGWILINTVFKSFILSVPSCFCCAMARG